MCMFNVCKYMCAFVYVYVCVCVCVCARVCVFVKLTIYNGQGNVNGT